MSYRLLIVVLVAVATLTGCDSHEPRPSPSPSPSAVCPSAGAQTSLGRPGLGRPAAWFRTSGGTIQITATSFDHGGIFDPDVGSTEVAIGTDSSASSPAADWTVTVSENGPSSLDLPAGRYWLTNTNGVEIRLALCGPGTLEVDHP